MAEPYEVRRAAARADSIERLKRAHGHAVTLTETFQGEQILVVLEGVAMFLYHLWATSLENQGLTFDEYAHDVGLSLGAQHERRQMRASGQGRPPQH